MVVIRENPCTDIVLKPQKSTEIPNHSDNHSSLYLRRRAEMSQYGENGYTLNESHDDVMKRRVGDKSVIKRTSHNSYVKTKEDGKKVHKIVEMTVYGCICKNWMGKTECMNPYAGKDSCGCYEAYKMV